MCQGGTALQGTAAKPDDKPNGSHAVEKLPSGRRSKKVLICLSLCLGFCLHVFVKGAVWWSARDNTCGRNNVQQQEAEDFPEGDMVKHDRRVTLRDRVANLFRKNGRERRDSKGADAQERLGEESGKGRFAFGHKKRKVGTVEDIRGELLVKLREELDAYPSNLKQRAKASGHELTDPTLLRFLEMAYWTLDAGGRPLIDAINQTISWRESFGAKDITPEQ
ncbi:unnamed protein product, partial [Choristocarpus tenellus]